MTSWLNRQSLPPKNPEPILRYIFSSSDTYAESTLAFLYSVLYSQKSAEPIYVHDTQGYFQPLLTTNPSLHYLKDAPSSGMNLANEMGRINPVVSSLSFAALKRSITSLYQFNQATVATVAARLSALGLARQTFDVGLVLLEPTDVQAALGGLKTFQKKTGKKTLRIFVMTEDVELLRTFATSGEPSWSFMSTLKQTMKTDTDSLLLKTLCDITLMQKVDALAVRLTSSIGKLVYLTNEKVTLQSQVVSLDGASWKVIG